MDNRNEKIGLSPFECTLAAMFFLVVFLAQFQDGNLDQLGKSTTVEAGFFSSILGEKQNNGNNTNPSTMNKVDSMFHFLEDNVGGEKPVFAPALSSDQKRFFNQVMQHIKLKRQTRLYDNDDWNAVLKSAAITYNDMESILEKCGMQDLSLVDWDAAETNVFYKQLDKKFGVPKEAARLFAQQMPSSVGDWAFFVETQLD